jgi:hypothetical protein
MHPLLRLFSFSLSLSLSHSMLYVIMLCWIEKFSLFFAVCIYASATRRVPRKNHVKMWERGFPVWPHFPSIKRPHKILTNNKQFLRISVTFSLNRILCCIYVWLLAGFPGYSAYTSPPPHDHGRRGREVLQTDPYIYSFNLDFLCFFFFLLLILLAAYIIDHVLCALLKNREWVEEEEEDGDPQHMIICKSRRM